VRDDHQHQLPSHSTSSTSSTSMSAHKNSPTKLPAGGDKIIPIRRMPLSDQSQLPSDYSATPGGTLFSTTPGGTRIIYERDFLMQCRNSPLTKSPPPNLPHIPGITHPANNLAQRENAAQDANGVVNEHSGKKHSENVEDAQFQLDI